MHVSSGPHPLPAGSQPCTLLTPTCWPGFLAWPWAAMVVMGPLAIPGHRPDATPLSLLGWWACALVGAEWCCQSPCPCGAACSLAALYLYSKQIWSYMLQSSQAWIFYF